MPDYIKLAATAARLVANAGRSVTFVRFDRSLQDVAKPWLGSVDPRATPDASEVVSAVFVEPTSLNSLGESTVDSDLLKRSTKIMIVAAGSDFTADLSKFDEVIDSLDNSTWRIVGVDKLQPASVVVAYYVGVAR